MFIPLTSVDAIDGVVAESRRHPVLIYKHSSTCGVCAQSYDELASLFSDPSFPTPIYIVVVQESRPVSNALAGKFGVRHETPQVLLVDGGVAKWSANHWHVTAQEVTAALTAPGRSTAR